MAIFIKNFIKINFFNLKSYFDQATQRKIKKAFLYSKINFNNAIMMSQLKLSPFPVWYWIRSDLWSDLRLLSPAFICMIIPSSF